MVLLVLEAQRALHLGRRVDERAQRVAGQRVIVAAGVHVVEALLLEEVLLRIHALEQEALDLVRGVQRVAVLRELLLGKLLQHAAHIGRIGRAALVDHVRKHQHLAAAEVSSGTQ